MSKIFLNRRKKFRLKISYRNQEIVKKPKRFYSVMTLMTMLMILLSYDV